MKTLKLGLVGLGRGCGMADIANDHPQAELVAVCDKNIDVQLQPGRFVHDIREKGTKVEGTYDDYDRFLEHDMDVVIVATPPEFHASQSIKALKQGMHVLSEIPSAMNLEEAHALVAAVRETDRIYMMGENLCWCGFVDAWQKWVSDGTVGKPSYIEGQYIHDLPEYIEPEKIREQYDASFDENKSGTTWRASFEPIRYCTHETGPLLDIVDDRIVKIMAVSSPCNVRPEIGTIDQQLAVGRTAKGAIIKLMAGFSVANKPSFHYFNIFGANGHLEFHTKSNVKLYDKSVPGLDGHMDVPVGVAPATLPPSWARRHAGHGGVDAAMMVDFFDTILHGKPNRIDVYRGLDYSLPGILAAESARSDELWREVPDPRSW